MCHHARHIKEHGEIARVANVAHTPRCVFQKILFRHPHSSLFCPKLFINFLLILAQPQTVTLIPYNKKKRENVRINSLYFFFDLIHLYIKESDYTKYGSYSNISNKIQILYLKYLHVITGLNLKVLFFS